MSGNEFGETITNASVAWTAQILARLPGFRALLLGGSRGRGDHDAFSDYDLVAIFEADAVAPAAETFFRSATADSNIVYAKRLPHANVANLIFAADWTRVDVAFSPAADLARLARRETRAVIDPQGLVATLEDKPPFRPSAREIEDLVFEFIRVFSLLPTVLGRDELEIGFSGAAMLQLALVRLASLPGFAKEGLTTRPGALSARRYVASEALDAIAGLPALAPERASIVAFHRAALAAFESIAPQIAADAGAEWPSAFLAAAKEHVEEHIEKRR